MRSKQQVVSPWVSVEDELPDPNEYPGQKEGVLIALRLSSLPVQYWSIGIYEDGVWKDKEHIPYATDILKITHWAEMLYLPEIK